MSHDAAQLLGVVAGALIMAGAIRLFWPSSTNVPARQRAGRWLSRVVLVAVLGVVVLAALRWVVR